MSFVYMLSSFLQKRLSIFLKPLSKIGRNRYLYKYKADYRSKGKKPDITQPRAPDLGKVGRASEKVPFWKGIAV